MGHALRTEPAALGRAYGLLLRSRASAAASVGMTPADMIADVERALRLGHLVGYLVRRELLGPLARPEDTQQASSERTAKETDFIRVRLTNGFDHPFEDEPFELTLKGQKTESGKLDGDGRLERQGVPFGSFTLEFPSLFGMTVIRDGQRIYDRGRGSPTALPAPPDMSHTFQGGDSDGPDDDDDDYSDDDEAKEYLPADGGAAQIRALRRAERPRGGRCGTARHERARQHRGSGRVDGLRVRARRALLRVASTRRRGHGRMG